MRTMTKTTTRILFLLAFVSMCFSLPAKSFAAPTEQEFNTIMNLSGKQRMLSQKMAKEALFIVRGIDVEKNREDLKNTTALFKKTLMGLKDGDASLGLPAHDLSRVKRELDKLQETYNEIDPVYESIINGETPTNDQLGTMDQKSLAVLAQANKIVSLFELEAKAVSGVGNQELAAQINIAGRQRMLTQKMTKELLLTQEGINVDGNKAAMMATLDLFDSSLAALKEGNKEMGILTPVADPKVLSQIGVVEKTWDQFQLLMKNADASPETMATIKEMNMTLMKQSNDVVESLAAMGVSG